LRFRLSPEFSGAEILKAPSGKVYASLDARCAACTVKGGSEKRCGPWPREYAKENPHGYRCPRREFPDADSAELSGLVSLGARTESGHLFRLRWDLAFGDRPVTEQARLLDRMLAAYGDELLATVFWPPPKAN
jgi:hypothetical protein